MFEMRDEKGELVIAIQTHILRCSGVGEEYSSKEHRIICLEKKT